QRQDRIRANRWRLGAHLRRHALARPAPLGSTGRRRHLADDGRADPGLMRSPSVDDLLARRPMDQSPELRLLFHRLNNQLGIILAHAELLEAKAADDMNRARAAQVIASTLDAMGTAKEIRRQTSTYSD